MHQTHFCKKGVKIKLRHSLGRPSRSDFVQSEVYSEVKDVELCRIWKRKQI